MNSRYFPPPSPESDGPMLPSGLFSSNVSDCTTTAQNTTSVTELSIVEHTQPLPTESSLPILSTQQIAEQHDTSIEEQQRILEELAVSGARDATCAVSAATAADETSSEMWTLSSRTSSDESFERQLLPPSSQYCSSLYSLVECCFF